MKWRVITGTLNVSVAAKDEHEAAMRAITEALDGTSVGMFVLVRRAEKKKGGRYFLAKHIIESA